jgi:hypothetical protein
VTCGGVASAQAAQGKHNVRPPDRVSLWWCWLDQEAGAVFELSEEGAA